MRIRLKVVALMHLSMLGPPSRGLVGYIQWKMTNYLTPGIISHVKSPLLDAYNLAYTRRAKHKNTQKSTFLSAYAVACTAKSPPPGAEDSVSPTLCPYWGVGPNIDSMQITIHLCISSREETAHAHSARRFKGRNCPNGCSWDSSWEVSFCSVCKVCMCSIVLLYVAIYSDSGGYDYDFVDTIADKYLCNICHCVLKDARLTECCGQNFCDSCLTKCLKTKADVCPFCQQRVKSIKNKEKIREINEFRIRCTYRKMKCNWVGKLEDIKRHLEGVGGCSYVKVECPNKYHERSIERECGVLVQRRHLANHQKNECEYRQYKCGYCGHVDTYNAIAGTGRYRSRPLDLFSLGSLFLGGRCHYEKCEDFPLKCPNKCGEEGIKRKDMAVHQGICPLEPLDCPFKSVGCKITIRRKEMHNHTQTNMEAHLLLVVRSHQELARKHEELVNELQKQGKLK